MLIDAYKGIDPAELNATRHTSEGKPYTLNHPDDLVVNMRYKGEGVSSANSQGWERSSSYYFRNLQQEHPEFFSNKNTARIDAGEAPKVDAKFVEHFPQYSGYENETLIHHHIGKDGQAVAVPQSMHKGSGEIHTIENKIGVTDNAKEFSNTCKETCNNDSSFYGKTADVFKQNQTLNYRQSYAPSDADLKIARESGANNFDGLLNSPQTPQTGFSFEQTHSASTVANAAQGASNALKGGLST